MSNLALNSRQPLDGRMFAASAVSVAGAAPASRLSLRARPNAVAALSKSLGLDLPTKPKASVTKGTRTAFWLGPDEWLILEDAGKDLVAECAKSKVLHSAVDVSQRNTAILVSGANAEGTISAGCPQNLSEAAFPVGSVSRTLLGKSEVIIHRVKPQAFRVECWRSFSDYVFTYLSEAARDSVA
ncbi:MAG: sarcosine oxidase subunit gamma [Rhizobiaceae bacterium]